MKSALNAWIRITACTCLLTTPLHGAEREVDFSREVLPILSENCFHCHGPDAADRKADLRLDTEAGSRQAITAGNPEKSEMLHRINSLDNDERMPPTDSGKRLSAEEVNIIEKWIEQGAYYVGHWAFQPLAEPDVPGAPGSSPIDSFVIGKLKENGLSLSPKASKQQLIRRASYDLTGLPPTWEEVKAFIDDDRPGAFAAVVDRLLASPAYGERWGRHWLDLARYADTHGGSAIGFIRFEFSYTYRDYVIDAFNQDLPYDRFVLEQIAADQLGLEENDPALAGLGFLTVGRQFRNFHDRIDDQIDVITRGLLGLTVSCARCHDHKFDPIPTTDYYSLHATLSNSRMPNDLPLVGAPPISSVYADRLRKAEIERDAAIHDHGEVMKGRLRMQVGMYLRELARGTPEQDTSTFFLSYRTEDLRPIVLERWRRYLASLDENDPVFGPWHRLSRLPAEGFAERAIALVGGLKKENGDPAKFAAEHRVGTKPPKWNPRVLQALVESEPQAFVEVAEVYGNLFGEVHRSWLTSLLEASLEAAPGGTLVPDQDPRHRVVNSAIERQLRHHLYHPDSPTSIDFTLSDNRRMINRGVRDALNGTFGAISNLNRTSLAPPRSMIVEELPEKPDPSFVFLRGNPVSRGESVAPRFISALSGESTATFKNGERRLGLARAIIDPGNPLARRVLVNWVWQHHFGHGLVRTSDDFGTRGDPPSHPELLDYLANQFQEDGWSIKQLHRRILLSDSWQQAAREASKAREKDPENRLLWRMPTRKLSMEEMRDSFLAVSGELDKKAVGGRPFEEKGASMIPRRTVYSFVNRDVIAPLASTFDGSDPSACTVKRAETMVPQQTLYALNSEYIQDRARAVAKRKTIRDAPSDNERIHRIYRTVYSREPDPAEIATALQYLDGADKADPVWERLIHVLLASNEFHFVD